MHAYHAVVASDRRRLASWNVGTVGTCDAARPALGLTRRSRVRRRSVAALHRSAPRARGHVAAGVQRPSRGGPPVRRPDRTFATVDHNVPTTARHLPIADALARGHNSTRCGTTAPSSAFRFFDLRLRRSGHRPRHRSRARADAAGHDDRVRRQSHHDARRVRRAGVRHRHHRGRTGAGDAVSGAAEAEGDARAARWRAGRRASAPRTSPWPSSASSAWRAARATSSSLAAAWCRR